MARPRFADILRRPSGEILLPSARWCDGSLCRLRGLQFRRTLGAGEGLILVGGSDSVAKSSIHMFFVLFPIAAVWINSAGEVTHKTLALPWRPYYASPTAARYVLEASPDYLERFIVGEKIDFAFL
ncbi:MAG TPA: DUF192 domain-containing protein [Anaerolineales bacterium]|nr:DUF192 domain-containing protein [Anaerolineales bacterium]